MGDRRFGGSVMVSEAQVLAHRRDARKSAGLRTPEGKAVVSRNAVKHGLLGREAFTMSRRVPALHTSDFTLPTCSLVLPCKTKPISPAADGGQTAGGKEVMADSGPEEVGETKPICPDSARSAQEARWEGRREWDIRAAKRLASGGVGRYAFASVLSRKAKNVCAFCYGK